MQTKRHIYSMIKEGSIKRGLKFEHIGKEIAGGVSLGFLVSGKEDGVFSQGVVCESLKRSYDNKMWLGLKKYIFDFFHSVLNDSEMPEKQQGFVVVNDAIFGHFLCIPYEVLMPGLREKKHIQYPQMQFEILVEYGSYRLKANNKSLDGYKDTLDPIFDIFSTPTLVR